MSIWLGGEIKDRRKSLGLTQATLAKVVGKSRASIANIEAGRQDVSWHLLVKFMYALDWTKISRPNVKTRTVKFNIPI